MTERINFKLAHNGITHKFASSFSDGQLFDAVRQKVTSVVYDDAFELFWKGWYPTRVARYIPH